MIEFARTFSRELQEHSTTVFTLAVIAMLLYVNGLRGRVRGLSRRQDKVDTFAAVLEERQTHVVASLERIEKTLGRHEKDERGFWKEVREFMNGGQE